LSQAIAGHTIYPYLLRGVKVTRVNHVWSTDITYIRLPIPSPKMEMRQGG
jgi:putative transposase